MQSTVSCSIVGCESRRIGRGLCSKHYQRLMRHGDPEIVLNQYAAKSIGRERARKGTPLPERLKMYGRWEGECFVWQGANTTFGYGVINISGRMEGVHRAAWMLANGGIPAGMMIRHKCDNPPCFRVEHLELGTRDQNMQDMVDRGRSMAGERSPLAKLTAQQVSEIRRRFASGEFGSSIVRDFPVHLSTLYGIKNFKSWRSIEADYR